MSAQPLPLPERWEIREQRDQALESISTVLDSPYEGGYKHGVADTCEHHLRPAETPEPGCEDPETATNSVDASSRAGYRAAVTETRAWLAGTSHFAPLDGF